MNYKVGDKVRMLEHKSIPKKYHNLIATVVRITTEGYLMLEFEDKSLNGLSEIDYVTKVNIMSEYEFKKCESYKSKNMCNNYCEMLQNGKCEVKA